MSAKNQEMPNTVANDLKFHIAWGVLVSEVPKNSAEVRYWEDKMLGLDYRQATPSEKMCLIESNRECSFAVDLSANNYSVDDVWIFVPRDSPSVAGTAEIPIAEFIEQAKEHFTAFKEKFGAITVPEDMELYELQLMVRLRELQR